MAEHRPLAGASGGRDHGGGRGRAGDSTAVSARRLVLWAGALAFALWELAAAIMWIEAAGGLERAISYTWARLRVDWLLLILLTDHLVIAGAALVWVWLDAGRRAWPVGARLGWALLFVALGTPALLGYLAERETPRRSRS